MLGGLAGDESSVQCFSAPVLEYSVLAQSMSTLTLISFSISHHIIFLPSPLFHSPQIHPDEAIHLHTAHHRPPASRFRATGANPQHETKWGSIAQWRLWVRRPRIEYGIKREISDEKMRCLTSLHFFLRPIRFVYPLLFPPPASAATLHITQNDTALLEKAGEIERDRKFRTSNQSESPFIFVFLLPDCSKPSFLF